MFFISYIVPLQYLQTQYKLVSAELISLDLRKPQDVAFTVVLRPSLPVTAACTSLPSSPCKPLVPWGAVVSQGRESVQPKPIFLLPWGCFSLVSCGSGGGAALCSQPPARTWKAPFARGREQELPHRTTCMLLGCLLEAVCTMVWTLPHLPLQSQKAQKCISVVK